MRTQLHGNVLCFNSGRNCIFKSCPVFGNVHTLGSIIKLCNFLADISRQVFVRGNILFLRLGKPEYLSLEVGYHAVLIHTAKLGHIIEIHLCFFRYGNNKCLLCGFNVFGYGLGLYCVMLKDVSLGVCAVFLVLIFQCGKELVIIVILESILVLLVGNKTVLCHKRIIYLVELGSAFGNAFIKGAVGIIHLQVKQLSDRITKLNHSHCSGNFILALTLDRDFLHSVPRFSIIEFSVYSLKAELAGFCRRRDNIGGNFIDLAFHCCLVFPLDVLYRFEKQIFQHRRIIKLYCDLITESTRYFLEIADNHFGVFCKIVIHIKAVGRYAQLYPAFLVGINFDRSFTFL